MVTLRGSNILKDSISQLWRNSVDVGWLPPPPTMLSAEVSHAYLISDLAVPEKEKCMQSLAALAARFVPLVTIMVTGMTSCQCALHFLATGMPQTRKLSYHIAGAAMEMQGSDLLRAFGLLLGGIWQLRAPEALPVPAELGTQVQHSRGSRGDLVDEGLQQ